MTERPIALAVIGTAYHTPTPHRLDVLDDVVIFVDAAGVIAAIDPVESAAAAHRLELASTVRRLTPDQRLLPGLIDLHIHAPQWPQMGTGLDLPLEQWLFDHTFPLESRYADTTFAREVWSHMVPTLLAHGTTTAVYFSSVHEQATVALAAQCVASGQRAFVGRVAMDHREGTPAWYRDESAAAGLTASRRSIQAIRELTDPRVQPIVTPRFIPACSDELLMALGQLAAETGTLVQTHCSESDWEHAAVLDRYGHTDAEALHRLGLLRTGTVLAHGNHLTDDDLSVIRSAGAGVAHCPMSNAYFANAVLPVRRLMASGVRVGLGTDIAGGAEPGLLRQCAHAVTASRVLHDGVDRRRAPSERGVVDSSIDAVTAFHLGTAAGADLLGVPVGRFELGRQFDAFIVDTNAGGALRAWPSVDDHARVFEKIVHLAGPAEISSVWVAGRDVVQRQR
jgi:guanine deaminase